MNFNNNNLIKLYSTKKSPDTMLKITLNRSLDMLLIKDVWCVLSNF